MENISSSFDMMVNTFTDADELMNFAVTWGIQDWPAVRLRYFQLKIPQYGDQFITEQLNDILHTLPSTDQRYEIDACVLVFLIGDEIEESTRLYLEDVSGTLSIFSQAVVMTHNQAPLIDLIRRLPRVLNTPSEKRPKGPTRNMRR